MVRSLVLIAVGCAYLIVASWIVDNEGRSYRDSLRQARLAAGPPPPTVDQPPAPIPALSPSIESPAAEKPREAINPPLVEHPPEPSQVAVNTGKESDRNPKEPAVPAKSLPPIEPRPSTPVTAEAERVAAWKNDPFWSRPELTRNWPLDQMTPQAEQELGQQLNRLILELNPEDPRPGRERVQEAARLFLDQLKNRDREYHFYVLNSDVANAFSHPGGYVYVTRKLLEMCPEDEPAPLEFIVGHEIAHVELRHALTFLSAREFRKYSEGTLQKLYLFVIPNGFPSKYEYDADAWAYNRMKRKLRSEHDCRQFLRMLKRYARDNGFENGRVKLADFRAERLALPKGEGIFSPIDNHLRSHPAAFDRLDHLKQIAAPVRP